MTGPEKSPPVEVPADRHSSDAEASGSRGLSRRELTAALAAGMTAATAGIAAWRRSRPDRQGSPRSARLVMVIDLRRCYGCQACSVACKSENGVPLGNFRSWVTPVAVGTLPAVSRTYLPRLCNHCDKPACVKVCPVGASIRRGDGIVYIDKQACIGCRYCMGACPYGVRSFGWTRPDEDELPFPSRAVGVADKCDLCRHRVDRGLVPSCVNTCPAGARTVGDLNDPRSEVARLVAVNPVQTLLPDLGTRPQVLYIGLDQRVAELAIAAGVRMRPVESAGGGEA